MMSVYLFVIGFMFQNFEIPSPSMVNTLLVGDHLLVDRTTLAPARSGRRLCIIGQCSGATLSCS